MKWDLYQPDRMSVLRAWTVEQIKAALATGEVNEMTLARPAGSNQAWSRLRDLPELQPVRGADAQTEAWRLPEATSGAASRPAEPVETVSGRDLSQASPPGSPPPVRLEPFVPRTDAMAQPPPPEQQAEPAPSLVAEVEDVSLEAEIVDELADRDQNDDDSAAEFTLAPRSSTKGEELDLTAMVDVAFQLILFFLVTATVAYYKTLQIPEPPKEQNRPNVAQAARSLDEIQADHILVEIDAGGTILVDHEPVPPEALVKRLITARRDTGRPGMLLLADYQALHRFAVLVTDAANEAGLQIKYGKPTNAPPPARAP